MTYTGKMNTRRLVSFLWKLVKGAEKKIFLILNKLMSHHSKIVKARPGKHKDKIKLPLLPN